MKPTLMFILILAMSFRVHGQTTYQKVYLSSATAKMNLIELPSQNLFVGFARGPGVSILNAQGSIIQSNYYWSDSILVQQSVRRSADNMFHFVTGYSFDSCSALGSTTIRHTHPLIGRMDSLGNVLALHHYRLNSGTCSSAGLDLEITGNKDVITWGGGRPGRQWSVFALRADSMGGLVWAKHFDQQGGIQFIKELPGGDLLAGMNMDSGGAVVARMDPEGNFLWCRSYIRPRGMVHDALIESDDSFIITGYTDSIASTHVLIPLPVTFQPKLFMMKLNGSGETQWCRGFDSAPNHWYTMRSSRIVKALDGNYVLLANLGQPGYNIEYRPILMKTDQNGDTLWTRSTGINDYTYLTADLLASSDGGYLHSGVMYGDLPQNLGGGAYIFKADSEGHFSCHEHQQPIEIVDLFPTDSSFVLTSVDGAAVYPAFVSDTTFAPINEYDACVITGLSWNTRQYPNRPTVRPNPSSGRFTVQFHDPLLAESYYSVFDALGKLLVQRRLPTGATLEEVDLSRFGRGMYVLKFTSPDGVCLERVVVE